jgi:hypothetical protein
LVEANHVFHYGRWWNPAKESQANDRAYRIGQTKPVHVYQLIAEDPQRDFTSFDEKLDRLIERRRRLAADFLAPMPSEEELERELFDDLRQTETGVDSRSTLHPLGEDDVRRLSWERFEALAAAAWTRRGARVLLTPKCGDEGVDVLALRDGRLELIQCKHTVWDSLIDVEAIAELTRAFEGYRAKRLRPFQGTRPIKGVLVTNGELTAKARRAAQERDIECHDANKLRRLIAEFPCTAADVEAESNKRLASMRDVQAGLNRLLSS